jgi:hypothetical protein
MSATPGDAADDEHLLVIGAFDLYILDAARAK